MTDGILGEKSTITPVGIVDIVLDVLDILLLATSKSGTLLLRRDQGDVAALLDSRRCRL